MKLTLLIVVALCVAVHGAAPRAAIAKCAKENKASPETINLTKTRKVPASQEEKCFIGCIYKEIGLTKGGGLNYSVAKGLVDLQYSAKPEQHKKALSILDTCKSIKGYNDDCVLGYKLRECLIVNSDASFTPFLNDE